MAFIVLPVSLDDGELNTIDETDCVNSYLAIVEAIIDPFHGRPVENERRVLEGDAVPPDVDAVLFGGPGESRLVYLRYVFTRFQEPGEPVCSNCGC
jgi:hypothetical protein